jgi:hypothetical protein
LQAAQDQVGMQLGRIGVGVFQVSSFGFRVHVISNLILRKKSGEGLGPSPVRLPYASRPSQTLSGMEYLSLVQQMSQQGWLTHLQGDNGYVIWPTPLVGKGHPLARHLLGVERLSDHLHHLLF